MTTDDAPLLLGVRHHGPGSARAVRAVLEEFRPGAVLVEGPPEGDALLEHAAHPRLRPPVALLAYARDDPGRAAFWPLAEFSPEWVAIRWALTAGVPVRFIDLPAAHLPSLTGEDDQDHSDGQDGRRDHDGRGGAGRTSRAGAAAGPTAAPAADQGGATDTDDPGEGARRERALRVDPLAVLAETAGYDDPERWWEDVVEHRRAAPDADSYAPFQALAEAMGALRERYGAGGHRRDEIREAHMRLRLRQARRECDGRVAVVCGAWHVPALAARNTVTADRALLRGLPKVRATATWVPWTHRRLTRHHGYGAGVSSPGWYGHLFSAPDRPLERWLTKVAGLLREEGRTVSSAHVIEAVRLAESLAALRGRPLAGLGETLDAARAVMCEGSDVPLALIHDRLVVGDVMGEVPDSVPAVPLQRDLERQQRRLRLKPTAAARERDLDLRKDTDAARSRLLHRLRLLDIDWGTPLEARGGTGTFRERWRLVWQPELSVRVAEAGVWGTTVYAAATAKAEAAATAATGVGEVARLAEHCLLAELPEALPGVMRALADRAALDTDVGQLAHALPALVRTVRYGDVRGTDASALRRVAEGLVERVCVGLPPACAHLDDDGAAELRGAVEAAHQAVALLARDGTEPRERWRAVLRRLATRDHVPGLLRGRCARLLLDDGQLADGEAARLMGLALSPGTGPAEAAAWVEGFLAGGGMLLLHDERLLALVDDWLAAVPAEAFGDVLPLLRRTFAAFEPGVRRTVGELVRRGPGATPLATTGDERGSGFGDGLDTARADAALPVVRLLLTGAEAAP